MPKMSLPETADSEKEARKALDEQNRLISEQSKKVNHLKDQVETLNQARSNPAYKNHLKDADLVKGLGKATGELSVEQSRL
ncbi:phage tail tape measure protein, partial [Xenorhabdus bovienii]